MRPQSLVRPDGNFHASSGKICEGKQKAVFHLVHVPKVTHEWQIDGWTGFSWFQTHICLAILPAFVKRQEE